MMDAMVMKKTQKGNGAMKKQQGGFTLLELLVTVVIVGVMAYVVMSALNGGTVPAKAQAIRSSSSEIGRAIGFLNVNLGTGIDTSSANVLSATGEDMLDVLVKGRSAVSSTYQTAYDGLGMRPLEDKIVPDGSGYRLDIFDIAMVQTGCPSNRICVSYSPVPADVLQSLCEKFGVTYTTTANNSGTSVRWTAASGGTHTVTMVVTP